MEGTAREPLLAASASADSSSAINTRIKTNEIESTTTPTISTDHGRPPSAATFLETNNSAGVPSSALLGCLTLGLVLVGLSLVLFVAFFPLWVFLVCWNLPIQHVHHTWLSWLILGWAQLIHFRLLWTSILYLRIFRTALLPIRRLLVPLVPKIACIESIREREPTQYFHVCQQQPAFRKSVRRHYRRMQKMYVRSGVQHQCVRAEKSLRLCDAMPLVWNQQQRAMQNDMPVEDFIKRALVLTLVPDGILDLYYAKSNDNNIPDELVCVQFSILQGNVWHWFMYFCNDRATKWGIWWHGALLAIQRGHQPLLESSSSSSSNNNNKIRYINAQMHQTDSKLHAGYTSAAHSDRGVLQEIYPSGFQMTRHIPDELMELRLWDSNEDNAHEDS